MNPTVVDVIMSRSICNAMNLSRRLHYVPLSPPCPRAETMPSLIHHHHRRHHDTHRCLDTIHLYASSRHSRKLSTSNDSKSTNQSGLNGEKSITETNITEITSCHNNHNIESAHATTQWKRSQYSKIEAKFQQTPLKQNVHVQQSLLEPLVIDQYEDVQPMWKGMESRVTKRAALTLEQRGGVSGRRNVRKSEEDMWLESGLYDTAIDKTDK